MKNVDNLFFITDVKNHESNKKIILEEIKRMGSFSFCNEKQNISNTNFHIIDGAIMDAKPFESVFIPVAMTHLEQIRKKFGYDNIFLENFWYQQYEKNDWHGWHNHNNCIFSSVYYLELPDGCSKTTFMIDGKEKEIDVKEGQILTFASYIRHCSKPNKSNKRKTIIAFNSNADL